VLKTGWPKTEPDLGRWLDRLFERPWAAQFREAARLPLGMVGREEYPWADSATNHASWSLQAAELFAARALQLQARGDSKAALGELAVALGLSRQFRHKATSRLYVVGLHQQFVALTGMNHWLQRLGPRRELLRDALAELNRHETLLPPFADYFKTDYIVFEDRRASALAFLQSGRQSREPFDERLIVLAGHVPWEWERETRLLHSLAARALAGVERSLWQPPAAYELPRPLPLFLDRACIHWLGPRVVESMRLAEATSLAQLRGTRLQVALALYAVEKGRPAASLDALVPKYVPQPLVDPFSGGPFHYRLSAGERIEEEPSTAEQTFLDVAAGQGVVWSVGLDRRDNGGTRAGTPTPDDQEGRWAMLGLDWIFLVPRWAPERQP
jgi:hypothetical protein